MCDAAACSIAGPGAPGDRNSCRVCWLRLGLDKPGAPAPALPPPPCAHLGGETGEQVKCGPCGGNVRVKLRACTAHGKCSTHKKLDGVACCQGCGDYLPPVTAPYGGPVIRNLLYHLLPRSRNGLWRANVEELRRRIHHFNGKRVVAIMTGHGLDDPGAVKDAFGGDVTEFIELPNNKDLREVVSFVPLWERVQTDDPRHITFYAHAKAVTRGDRSTAWPWAQICYGACLDYLPLVEDRLQRYAVAGPFQRCLSSWTESASEWHYSGTFFWARNREVFRRDWRRVDQFWSGTEPWVGIHFRAHEACCLFYRWHRPGPGLYDRGFFDEANRAWEKWTAKNWKWHNEAHDSHAHAGL